MPIDVSTATDPLAQRLAVIVGPNHVLTEPDLMAPYEVDWTTRWSGRARLVVRPADTEEVALVMAACTDAGAAVVAQGGNTGLVGGGVPRNGEVVVSLRRLDTLAPIEPGTSQLVAGAGVVLADAQRHARASGLELPIDFAARDSATLGGIVATNAGGERVLRHGPARAQVLGLEAVLADGRIVRRMTGLAKDSAGFDTTTLMIGSEGTLGLITKVRLRLVPHLPERAVALLAVDGTATAIDLVRRLARLRPELEAAELFHAEGLDLVCEILGMPRPFRAEYPTYVVVELAAESDPTDDLAAALARLDGILDAAIAADGPRREALWRYREAHGEAINTAGVPLKLDVAVPPAHTAELDAEVRTIVAELAPGARLVVFGHLAEGNLHVNVLGVVGDADRGHLADRITSAVLGIVARLGGSIGAEHGVGQAKVPWLGLTRSEEELDVMTAVKRALDPRWLLNPGVVLPVPADRGSRS